MPEETEERKAVERREDYTQVVIWPNTIVCTEDEDKSKEFEGWMQDNFGVRAQYLEEYKTKPDPDDFEGKTGDRNDAVFALHKDDAVKFALPKLQIGARWIEDVLDNAERNGYLSIFPEYLKDYRTW